MTNEAVIPISDSESSTGSNGDTHTVTPPPPPFECESVLPNGGTTMQPLPKLRPRQNSPGGVSTLTPPPLSQPPFRSNRILATNAIPSLSQPMPPMNTVPMLPMAPTLSEALQINSNAVGSGAHRGSFGINFSRPFGGGNSRLPYPVGLTYPRPYGRRERGSGSLINSLGVNYSRPLERGSGSFQSVLGANYPYPLGANFSHGNGIGSYQRYHPYLMRSNDHTSFLGRESLESTRREVDYLSHMGGSNPAPRRFAPSNEMLAEWGATLTLGARRRRSLDLNLRLN